MKRSYQQRKMRDEIRRQVATQHAALERLESLCSEETGPCWATRAVRRAIKRGEKLLREIAESAGKRRED